MPLRFNFNRPQYEDAADIEKINENFDKLEEEALAKSDIVNNTTDGGSEKVLSAEQGKQLSESIAGLKANSFRVLNDATIGTSSWETVSTGVPGMTVRAKVTDQNVTQNDVIISSMDQASADTGLISPKVSSFAGGYYVYARSTPTLPLTISPVLAIKKGG